MSCRRLQMLVALLLARDCGERGLARPSNGHLRFLDRLESTLTDLRTLVRGVKAPPDLVTIVAIDDTSSSAAAAIRCRAPISPASSTPSRSCEPKVDRDRSAAGRPRTADGDAALAKIARGASQVLAAAAVFPQHQPAVAPDDDGPLAALPKADRFLLPLQTFADHAEVGVANVTTDQTGTPLSVPMLFRTQRQDRAVVSAARRVRSRSDKTPTIEPNRLMLGDRSIATDIDYALPLAYYGPRRTIRTVSAAIVLDGKLDRAAIQDRIVVIGATVTGGGDFFPTPFDSRDAGRRGHLDRDHASGGRRRHPARPPVRLADAVIASCLPMLLVGLLAWRRSAVGLVAVGAVMIAWAGCQYVLLSRTASG